MIGVDQYGNARVVDWTFSATSTGQYWFWSCGGTIGWSLGSGEYTCFYSYPGDLNVTARAASGEQRSVRFLFRS